MIATREAYVELVATLGDAGVNAAWCGSMMPELVLHVDGGLLSLLGAISGDEPSHAECAQVLRSTIEPYATSAHVLARMIGPSRTLRVGGLDESMVLLLRGLVLHALTAEQLTVHELRLIATRWWKRSSGIGERPVVHRRGGACELALPVSTWYEMLGAWGGPVRRILRPDAVRSDPDALSNPAHAYAVAVVAAMHLRAVTRAQVHAEVMPAGRQSWEPARLRVLLPLGAVPTLGGLDADWLRTLATSTNTPRPAARHR
ncbi:hypothetical protein [Streptomyces sp. NPDC088925]|uniref:hypothetical protein n=1 Tax=Streptomyces sp. NPDC088925 TaxID=3365914 RepID=UPI003809B960